MAKLVYYADAKEWIGRAGTAIVPRSQSITDHHWFLKLPGVLSGRFGIYMFEERDSNGVTVLGHNLIVKEVSPRHRAIPNYPGSWGTPVREEAIILPLVDDRTAAALSSFAAKAIVDGRIDLAEPIPSRTWLLEQEPRPWITAIASLALEELLANTD